MADAALAAARRVLGVQAAPDVSAEPLAPIGTPKPQ
jgi:hypothetical protein